MVLLRTICELPPSLPPQLPRATLCLQQTSKQVVRPAEVNSLYIMSIEHQHTLLLQVYQEKKHLLEESYSTVYQMSTLRIPQTLFCPTLSNTLLVVSQHLRYFSSTLKSRVVGTLKSSNPLQQLVYGSQVNLSNDHRYMPQIVSSAIVNAPPARGGHQDPTCLLHSSQEY